MSKKEYNQQYGMHWDAQGNATPARKRNDSGRLDKVAKNGLKGQNCYPRSPAQTPALYFQ